LASVFENSNFWQNLTNLAPSGNPICNVFVTALPQSNAEVERTFSCLNNNKNKLRDWLAVCILSSENCQVNLRSTKDLCIYMAKQWKHFLKILKLLMLSLTRLFLVQPAGEL